MRNALMLVPVFAVILLAGCLSDEDWKRIWIEVGKQAVNQTVSDLTGGTQHKCEAGMSCESGRIVEIKCGSDGKETKSVVALPYSCKGGTLITSTCVNGVFGQSQSSGSYYCNARGYLEEATCSDNVLNRDELGELRSCYGTDTGENGIERMYCSWGTVETSREPCPVNTTCRGTGDATECS